VCSLCPGAQGREDWDAADSGLLQRFLTSELGNVVLFRSVRKRSAGVQGLAPAWSRKHRGKLPKSPAQACPVEGNWFAYPGQAWDGLWEIAAVLRLHAAPDQGTPADRFLTERNARRP